MIMAQAQFSSNIEAYSEWKKSLIETIEQYDNWLNNNQEEEGDAGLHIFETLQALRHDRITIAFVAEFSRGKTELINSIFFAQYKTRLLPSSAGRTTMCPTELYYNKIDARPCLRLLPIETRLEDISLNDFKKDLGKWAYIELNPDSIEDMSHAFTELVKTKRVSFDEARRLGLHEDVSLHEYHSDHTDVMIPMWRHALINFPHPLLQQGLVILDTPGLNSLGSEPELTVSMLPGAQAVVFILGADTGVTKSDMDIWQKHLHIFRHSHRHGLLVALNKVDTLWDDLKTWEEIANDVARQCMETARTLKVKEEQVLPISAQKGLVAKVRGDKELLKESNLDRFEEILAKEIMPQKEKLVRDTLISDMSELMLTTKRVITSKLKSRVRSLNEFTKFTDKSELVVEELLEETRKEQVRYRGNLQNLRDSRQILAGHSERLQEMIHLEKLDALVEKTRKEMKGSWTTAGLKKAQKDFFEGSYQMMEAANKQLEITNRMVQSVYNRFKADEDFSELEPNLFSLDYYLNEINDQFKEGEDFRESVITTFSEQNFVIRKFFLSLVSRTRNIYYQLNKELDEWSLRVLSPLISQVKAHKKDLDEQLAHLKKVSQSKEAMDARVHNLKQECAQLQKQLNEINAMLTTINTPMPEIDEKASTVSFLDNVTPIRQNAGS